jgi:DNA phosphorothioation system restriction enzyme
MVFELGSGVSLRKLEILETYRSDDCDLVRDFYEPCLQRSRIYDRAVGFFSSSALALVARGLTAFIQAGGRMRLVTSPKLSEADVTAIAQGLEQRDEVIQRALLRSFDEEVVPDLVQQRLAALTWLLAQGLLDIKLAVPKSLRGLYHEKLGIFADAEGNLVTFGGSANESENALQHNFEVLEIFTSWQVGVEQRALRRAQAFEDLWQNRTAKVEVIPFPEAVKRSLIQKYCPGTPPTQEPYADRPSIPEPRVADEPEAYNLDVAEVDHRGVPINPSEIILRDYQQQAIANWFANKGRGTLKMATGSGKTITALAIAAELYAKIQLQALIVVCPYRHLVNQWARECEKFGLMPILAFDTVQTWQGELSRQLYGLRSDRLSFLTVITTNATLTGIAFQSQLPYFPEKTLIIGDEAHNLGSPKLAASLPRTIGLRLALSATPERYFDDLGTQSLLDYFGPVLEPEFTLADALQAGALVRYRYYPLLVELTETEAERYSELTTKIGQALSIDEDVEGNSALSALSMRRAKLIANAAHKLTALRSLMQSRLDTTHTLFYCGDGSVEDAVSAATTRHLDAVTYLLGKELGYRVNTYTAETSLEERETLRQQFESGELQGLVAIRCLDEGVDIPATRTAVILASSNNPRQFIQRRGRVLRPAPGKERAEIFDMIVLPPDLERKTLDAERSLLRKELQRFLEFADLADNAGAARVQLLDLQKRYGLLDM